MRGARCCAAHAASVLELLLLLFQRCADGSGACLSVNRMRRWRTIDVPRCNGGSVGVSIVIDDISADIDDISAVLTLQSASRSEGGCTRL